MFTVNDYLNIDFSTIKKTFKDKLRDSDTFKDVDYEGSNISVLIELLSYIGELNTFYLNRIAKNIFSDSAELYETCHTLSSYLGYKPRGYLSAVGTANITIKNASGYNGSNGGFNIGDTLYIADLKELSDGSVNFLTTESLTFTASTAEIKKEVNIIQGDLVEYTLDYDDYLNQKILLKNEKFAHNSDVDTAFLTINTNLWDLKKSLYSDLSIYDTNLNVFELIFDKYKRYNILFSVYGTVPQKGDSINLKIIQTLAEDGNTGPNKINTDNTNTLVYNITRGRYLNPSCYTINNETAISGGKTYEDITVLKLQGKSHFNSQNRLVSIADYKTFLKTNITEIQSVNVYGEQELYPDGKLSEFNKIRFTIYPYEWGTTTITYTTEEYTINDNTSTILIPQAYSTTFTNDIKTKIRDIKFLNTYEVFDVPEIPYFIFNFGIRTKKLYSFDTVAENVKQKIQQYFLIDNLYFGYTLDFKHIQNWVLDPTTSDIDISGVDSFIIRDVDCLNFVIGEHDVETYPRYETEAYSSGIENKLRRILFSVKQFPQISINLCIFNKEN